ncbi:endothelin-converting enzyme 1 [Phellopilus nigrolimitatus]|nr:endothelin-converting enzyme 1 [Phellopilus nigrolimitatus]
MSDDYREAYDRAARPSTEHEDAPLLRDPDIERTENGTHRPPRKSFSDHVNSIAQEPLTTLTKILLVLALFLLLLTSVFIGLFAGAEHKLNHQRGDPRHPPVTTTISGNPPATTTILGTTSIITSTEIQTTTVPSAPLPTGKPGSELCTTTECVVLSAAILQGLDETQDPCEDFYDFTNGGWLSKNEIPPGKGSYGSFDMVSQGNKRVIRKILDPVTDQVSVTDTYDEETLTKLRDLYSSCMNEDLLNERDIEPLQYISTSTKGQDTLTESNVKEGTKHGLTAAVSYLHSRGIGGLFNFEIDGDVGVDPNFMTLWFYQPDLGLPSKEYYNEKPIRKLYEDTLARMLLALDDGVDAEELLSHDTEEQHPKKPINKTERARAIAPKVVEFERRIANASLDLYSFKIQWRRTTPFRFAEFASQLPQIDFSMYFSTFTPRNFPDRVILTSTTYATSLSDILSTTSSDVVEAYLVTRAALALAPFLGHDTEVWKADRALGETLQGIKKGQVPDRADWCVQRVEDAMGFAAGRFFVQESFGGDSKEKGTKVITDIINAFKNSLENLKWMDKESASAAAEKADAIRVKVGYPLSPDTKSARSIALYYRLVMVDKKMFFESVLNAQINEEFKKWQTLGKQRDPETWLFPPSIVNAYFNPPANEIVFPAGILQPPFFSYKWPSYLTYGAFGHVAAHELTHAFDSAGRLYNQHGKLEQWWTNATSDGFKEIQNCISEQYSQYTIDDGKGGKIHVNVCLPVHISVTSGENIGDSGLIQAYRAWRGQFHTSVEEGREYLLPGLDYTQEQLFFIGFSQIWAQLMKPAAAVQRVRTDPHSPNRYRVEGTLSNIPEFAAAFQCKPGSKLNPPKEKRCVLW